MNGFPYGQLVFIHHICQFSQVNAKKQYLRVVLTTSARLLQLYFYQFVHLISSTNISLYYNDFSLCLYSLVQSKKIGIGNQIYLFSRQGTLRDAGHIELPFHSWCEDRENEEQEATKIVLLLSDFSIVYISCKSGHGCAPFDKPKVLVHFVNLFAKAQ